MIDIKLVELVTRAIDTLAGMKNARPSQILAVKEEFAGSFIELLKGAALGIPVEHKIKAFDNLLTMQVDALTASVQNALNGKGYFQDDDHHDTYEEVMMETLGSDIFDAINALETLLSGLGDVSK